MFDNQKFTSTETELTETRSDIASTEVDIVKLVSRTDEVVSNMQQQDPELRNEIEVAITTGQENVHVNSQRIETKLNSIESMVQGSQQVGLT